jgi:ankyrin repeat protein
MVMPKLLKSWLGFLTPSDLRAEDNFAIRMASDNGHAEVVKILVGFLTPNDLRAKDNYAIRMASYYGHTAVVDILTRAFTNCDSLTTTPK